MVLEKQGVEAILLSEKDTKLGGVETYEDAQKWAGLFIKHQEAIASVLVVLPNFGDERGVA